jgi:hypothetical protein
LGLSQSRKELQKLDPYEEMPVFPEAAQRPDKSILLHSYHDQLRQLRHYILKLVCLVSTITIYPNLVFAQDPADAFLQSQVLNEWRYVENPALAQARLAKIWFELYRQTGAQYRVIPLQTDSGGLTISPSTILIDPSILADPSEEVTRFLLAHEWGHERNGDPLKQLTSLGRYQIMTAGTRLEDGADLWATFFMKKTHHNVRPIMKFFCSIPVVEGDTHSSGPQRAAKIALNSDISEDNPCDDFPETARHEAAQDPQVALGIQTMAGAIGHAFDNVRGGVTSDGFKSTVTLPRNGKNLDCDVSNDTCIYYVNRSDSLAGTKVAFEDFGNAVTNALSRWKRFEYHCPLRSNQLRDIVWFPAHRTDPGKIEEQLYTISGSILTTFH